jgi:hypothetical protein
VKLKNAARALDSAICTGSFECMTSNNQPAKPPAGEREARLAEALRENLRRRKAAKPPSQSAPDEKQG